jgi:hypothetical protein
VCVQRKGEEAKAKLEEFYQSIVAGMVPQELLEGVFQMSQLMDAGHLAEAEALHRQLVATHSMDQVGCCCEPSEPHPCAC